MYGEYKIDRRKTQRYDISLTAIIKPEDEYNSMPQNNIDVEILNLSENGVAFISDETFKKGTKFIVEIIFLESDYSGYIKFYNSLNIKGSIVNCFQHESKNHVCVSFEKLDTKTKKTILNLIRSSTRSFEPVKIYRSCLVPS